MQAKSIQNLILAGTSYVVVFYSNLIVQDNVYVRNFANTIYSGNKKVTSQSETNHNGAQDDFAVGLLLIQPQCT